MFLIVYEVCVYIKCMVSHSVCKLLVHIFQKEVYYSEALFRAEFRDTKLTAWFELNKNSQLPSCIIYFISFPDCLFFSLKLILRTKYVLIFNNFFAGVCFWYCEGVLNFHWHLYCLLSLSCEHFEYCVMSCLYLFSN